MYHGKTIGVVIPAHNESQSIARVVTGLLELSVLGELREPEPIIDQLVVCDNASLDDTADRALAAGAVVVHEPNKGYGAACQRALTHLPDVDWIVFVDGDNAMRATDLPKLLEALNNGAELVIGSRTLGEALGEVESGALTPHQRWGNWLAARLLNAIWRTHSGHRVTDLGPFRAITSKALDVLEMQDQAYGWTAEMQAKALAAGLCVTEVPVASLRRIGHSKVSGTLRGTLGASRGILGTIARIGFPALWAQLARSFTIGSAIKDSLWKKPS